MWNFLYYLMTLTFTLFCSQVLYAVYFLGETNWRILDKNSQKKKKPVVISVDGNIGSGKSTLIKLLREEYGEQIYFAAEPVDAWSKMTDEEGNNLLHNFYTDKKRWSYSFQNIAYITRAKELQKALQSGKPIVITERSVMTDRNVFAKMLFTDNFMNKMEMAMYDAWFGLFNTRINYTFYLQTTVDNCVARIKKRGRDGEDDIERGYLEALEKAHEDWLAGEDDWYKVQFEQDESHEPGEVITLDGNPDTHEERLSVVRKILSPHISV